MNRQPTIRELRDRLDASVESARVVEALRVALGALALYAKPSTWSDDDWGIKAVNQAEYADAGKRARRALKRIEKIMDENYVPKALREEQ